MEYLEYNEGQTKTRTGKVVRNVLDSKPRMYAVPEFSTCPVKMYKANKAKHSSDFCSSSEPLYLAAVTHRANPREDEQWFLRCPLERNKMKHERYDKRVNLPDLQVKRITNTSVHKKLLDNNIPDVQAVYIAGHKTLLCVIQLYSQ